MSAWTPQTGSGRVLPEGPGAGGAVLGWHQISPVGGLGAASVAAPALVVEPVLPVGPVLHGLAVGVVAVHGYIAGVLLAAVGRWLRGGAAPPGPQQGAGRWLLWLLVVVLGTLAFTTAPGPIGAATIAVVAVAAFLALLLAGRLLRDALRLLVSGARALPPPAVALVVVLLVVPVHPLSAAVAGPETGTGALGREGRVFLAGRPDAATLAAAIGHPIDAVPVRVYVGLDAAPTPEERARIAVEQLERAGGLRRTAVLVAVPTGSGWVNPAAVGAGEMLTRGDLATVVVQYAQRPSWQEYLLGSGAAERSAAALVTALRNRLDELPVQSRPQLLVYGESLGAIAALTVRECADAIVVAGIPAAAWQAPLAGVTAVLHADDPVGWFSPWLLVARPRGWSGTWIPIVSFWLTAASLVPAVDAPPGHGHRYGPELIGAWRAAGITGLAQ